MVSFWDRSVDRMGLEVGLLEFDRTLVYRQSNGTL